ncbi:MAG: hypothetical protein WC712_00255 [Candidatus Brocadiia bacterium]
MTAARLVLLTIGLLLLGVGSTGSVNCEEKPEKLLIRGDKLYGSPEKGILEYDGNVEMTWGDKSLTCGYLKLTSESGSKSPRNFEATGCVRDAGPEERAKAKLNLKMPGYDFRCCTVTGTFHEKTLRVATLRASGDVWAQITRGADTFTLHSAAASLTLNSAGDKGTVILTSDAGLPRVEVAGKGFVASELEGTVEFSGETYVHSGKDIEMTLNVTPGKLLLPENLKELQADRLVATGGTFVFEPAIGRFRFQDGATVKCGDLLLKAPMVELRTDSGNKLPRSISASGGKAACSLTFRGMNIDSDTMKFSFTEKGDLIDFTADGNVAIRVMDSANRLIKGRCARAIFLGEKVTLEGDPKVIIVVPSEKIRITETRGEFAYANGRWDHTGTNAVIENNYEE